MLLHGSHLRLHLQSLSRRVNSVSRWARSSTNIRISSSTGVVIIDCCFLSPFFGINEYNDYLLSSTIRHSHAVAREKYSERKYKSGLQMILALTGNETGYQGIHAELSKGTEGNYLQLALRLCNCPGTSFQVTLFFF